jgi:hypothetical protein
MLGIYRVVTQLVASRVQLGFTDLVSSTMCMCPPPIVVRQLIVVILLSLCVCVCVCVCPFLAVLATQWHSMGTEKRRANLIP